MKKILFLGTFLLQAAFMSAQYTISVKDIEVAPGSTFDDGRYLEIEMSYPAEDKIRMAQFNIMLPEHMTFDEGAFELDSEYFPEYKEGRQTVQPFSVGYNTDGDGSTVVAVTTTKDYYFGKNEGVALKAYILTDDDFAGGKIVIDRGEFYSPTTGSHKDIVYEATATTPTDGISTITIDGTKGDVYNTAGQRVSRTSKGLYIQNGKKVVKK